MDIPKPFESNRVTDNERLSAEEIKKFMNDNGLSKKEFSEILGVSGQAVKLWLENKRDFSVPNSRLIRLFIKYPTLLKEF